MNIKIPNAGIVLLIGPSNSGKSTFLLKMVDERSILKSEIASSDEYRQMVGDTDFIHWQQHSQDESEVLFQQYHQLSSEAFQLMDAAIEARCRLNKTTFVDATHLRDEDRKKYILIAQKLHVPITAVILDISEETLLTRDSERDQPRGKKRIKQQFHLFKKEKRTIKKEGFNKIYYLNEEALDHAFIERGKHPLYIEADQGIDIIGDIHGCFNEMIALLEKLGYEKKGDDLYTHPSGRKFLSLGDIMSRGPSSLMTIHFMMKHVDAGLAYMIDSNHGWKIARWLDGRNVNLNHGDEKAAEEIDGWLSILNPETAQYERRKIKEFLFNAPSHYILTKNSLPVLVCAHAGIKDEFIGKQSKIISDFCRYGDTDGFNESGKPIRKDWFIHHGNGQLIIWGHDPKPQPLQINHTINIDQGVVFGGRLTSFRFPEKKLVSVPSLYNYAGTENNPLIEWEKKRLDPPNIANYIKGYTVQTERLNKVKIHEDYVKPAIDLISTSAVPLEQLVYIPPTMSPVPKPSKKADFLEHPEEAIAYYRQNGIETLIAEKKHMGSRAILFIFKDEAASMKYTGLHSLGTIYTRTGRPFFNKETEERVLKKLNKDLHKAAYFNKNKTDYLLLDAEIMPWNLKAKELINNQYEHVAKNAKLDRFYIKRQLEESKIEHSILAKWQVENETKIGNAKRFETVYKKYCWEVVDIENIQIAPFHLLAHSNEMLIHHPHEWHMKMNEVLSTISSLFVQTEYKMIQTEADENDVMNWWEEMTADGHEGIVIKPNKFISENKGKLLQPAIKVRGRTYLHIIYGMDYLLPNNLSRLKERNVGKKQRLALQEFTLGIEGISRFVQKETIERVHECVLGVLALESDPADPRL
ncbi:polynucleotide kinase-phosphatase [Bacillus sp. CRN 9]|nr:polynucleotide kinase-phosphatase [Bacillus sp. CRN 9]